MSKRKTIVSGQRFNHLVAIKEVEPIGSYKARAFLFKCDCGNERIVRLGTVLSGLTKSCGCKKYKPRSSSITHGMSTTRFYRIWFGMKDRCSRKKNTDYKHYGGRGIKVCERWQKFENFYEDMYFKYGVHENKFGEVDTSIDRINCNGNYEPSNCRWATLSEQKRNARSNINITYKGKTQCIARWAKELGLNKTTISRRFKKGLSLEDVFSQSLAKKFVTYKGKTQCVTEWEDELGIGRGIIKHRLLRGYSVELAMTKGKIKSGPGSPMYKK